MMSRLTAAIAVALFSGPAANACVTIKVYNESDYKIDAYWQAGGCAGISSKGDLFVCAHNTLEPKTGSASHNFAWGKTGQIVNFRYDGIDSADGLKVTVPYSYHSNHTPHYRRCHWNCFAGTPGHCSTYHVHVTNQTIAEDSKWYRENLIGKQYTQPDLDDYPDYTPEPSSD